MEANIIDVLFSMFREIFSRFLVFFLVLGGLFLVALIFVIICDVLLYKKCGKPGWAAIVPFYNTWVLNEISGSHVVVFILSIAGTVLKIAGIGIGRAGTLLYLLAAIVMDINIAKKFHKSDGFVVGLIFLPFIFLPILALDNDSKYDESVPVKPFGIF